MHTLFVSSNYIIQTWWETSDEHWLGHSTWKYVCPMASSLPTREHYALYRPLQRVIIETKCLLKTNWSHVVGKQYKVALLAQIRCNLINYHRNWPIHQHALTDRHQARRMLYLWQLFNRTGECDRTVNEMGRRRWKTITNDQRLIIAHAQADK